MDNFEINSKTYRMSLKLPDGFDPRWKTPEGVEYIDFDTLAPGLSNCYRMAAHYCKGKGLDVGASYFRVNQHNGFPGSVPVDIAIPGSGQAENLVQEDLSQNYVIASHILEHVSEPEKAVREAHRVLAPRGILFTYSPWPGTPEWDPALNPKIREAHKWQPSPGSLSRLLILSGFHVVYCEWEPDHINSFIVVGRKS